MEVFGMKYYAYVLFSPEYKRLYKGHAEDLEHRLYLHNTCQVKSTKPFVPWEIKYYETFATWDEAIKREKYFKTASGRRYLKSKLKDIL
ncbi:GIY-YIG nuclease family protein [Desulfosarcina sp.]|nr:GIY-YIG nuclease family protein [Desulfosarcina sp.]